MEIVRQLGELFLQAVPTVLIVFAFYLFLRSQFFKPLLRVMRERQERTTGAQRAAEAGQAAAQESVRAYEEALKKARAEIYAEQDAARRQLLDERNEQIREARTRAGEQVRVAKERIEAELTAARKQLGPAGDQLAAEIARLILERRPIPPPRPSSEAR
jgi:F-type H+-transporting ATPase subunit b